MVARYVLFMAGIKLHQVSSSEKINKMHNTHVFFYTHICFCFRNSLAAIHWNANAGRKLATTKDGSKRYSVSFPKAKKGEATLKKIKEKTTYGEVVFVTGGVMFIALIVWFYYYWVPLYYWKSIWQSIYEKVWGQEINFSFLKAYIFYVFDSLWRWAYRYTAATDCDGPCALEKTSCYSCPTQSLPGCCEGRKTNFNFSFSVKIYKLNSYMVSFKKKTFLSHWYSCRCKKMK